MVLDFRALSRFLRSHHVVILGCRSGFAFHRAAHDFHLVVFPLRFVPKYDCLGSGIHVAVRHNMMKRVIYFVICRFRAQLRRQN